MKEVNIDKGRERDNLTLMMKDLFDKVNTYNEENPDNQIDVMVLSRDKHGGASFLIGEVDNLIRELYESASRHDAFIEFIKKILDVFGLE